MDILHFSLWQYLLIALLGFCAGIINVLAGGGSNLTLPMLIMFGVPPDIANGSNRVGIFIQSITGAYSFHRQKKLPNNDLVGILTPTLIGGICGALLASFLPNTLLKPLLLGTMLFMAGLILFKPSNLLHSSETIPLKVKESRSAFFWLWIAGVYGGFVQAGVGFVLIMAISSVLHYDLVRANALKIICALTFTTVALLIFIINGKVNWPIGLTLACGAALGSMLGVKIAIQIKPITLKRVLFIMTLLAVLGASISGAK